MKSLRSRRTPTPFTSGKGAPGSSPRGDCHLDGFSVERLMHFLNALDRDVEIVIRKSLDRGEA